MLQGTESLLYQLMLQGTESLLYRCMFQGTESLLYPTSFKGMCHLKPAFATSAYASKEWVTYRGVWLRGMSHSYTGECFTGMSLVFRHILQGTRRKFNPDSRPYVSDFNWLHFSYKSAGITAVARLRVQIWQQTYSARFCAKSHINQVISNITC